MVREWRITATRAPVRVNKRLSIWVWGDPTGVGPTTYCRVKGGGLMNQESSISLCPSAKHMLRKSFGMNSKSAFKLCYRWSQSAHYPFKCQAWTTFVVSLMFWKFWGLRVIELMRQQWLPQSGERNVKGDQIRASLPPLGPHPSLLLQAAPHLMYHQPNWFSPWKNKTHVDNFSKMLHLWQLDCLEGPSVVTCQILTDNLHPVGWLVAERTYHRRMEYRVAIRGLDWWSIEYGTCGANNSAIGVLKGFPIGTNLPNMRKLWIWYCVLKL